MFFAGKYLKELADQLHHPTAPNIIDDSLIIRFCIALGFMEDKNAINQRHHNNAIITINAERNRYNLASYALFALASGTVFYGSYNYVLPFLGHGAETVVYGLQLLAFSASNHISPF